MTPIISAPGIKSGQNYRLILITDEKSQLLKVTLVSPIKVPKLRMKEATFVLNFLNLRSPVGKAVPPPGEGWTLDREASARKDFRVAYWRRPRGRRCPAGLQCPLSGKADTGADIAECNRV